MLLTRRDPCDDWNDRNSGNDCSPKGPGLNQAELPLAGKTQFQNHYFKQDYDMMGCVDHFEYFQMDFVHTVSLSDIQC